jgi:hypothetical protein
MPSNDFSLCRAFGPTAGGNQQERLAKLSFRLRRAAVIGLSAVAFLGLATSAQATLVFTNGGFETTTNGNGQLGYNTNAAGWATTGYNFLFASGTADTTGATGQYGNLKLWGPADGSANGMPATSPDGGNFVAADGAFQIGAIQQTITGLTTGDAYTVGFWWAGAQQSGYNNATTEQWQVSLGGQTQSTVVVSNASHGFTGWVHKTFTFTADNTSDVLSFLAVGTPNGVPPFVLLDGVTVAAAVPEPGSWSLMAGGLALMCGLGVLRSKKGLKN